MTTIREKSLSVGKYLVSPLVKLTDAGTYAPSVSIRSGKGQATHDRVLRFDARFPTREGARRDAARQGLTWLDSHLGVSRMASEDTSWPKKS